MEKIETIRSFIAKWNSIAIYERTSIGKKLFICIYVWKNRFIIG